MFGNFCCDEFLSLNETWDTEVPDFSSCFQDIILVLIPSIVFSIIGLLQLFLLSKQSSLAPLPWTWRIMLKLTLATLLLITSITWCVLHLYSKFTDESVLVPDSTMTASFARSFTYIIIIALMLRCRTCGITTSNVLSVFWICFACFGVVIHRSVIMKWERQGSPLNTEIILDMFYYPLIYIELILSFFGDEERINFLEKRSLFEEAPFLPSILFLWFSKTVYQSFRKLLTVEDFLPLTVKLRAYYVYEAFSKNWQFSSCKEDIQKLSLAWALLKSFWPRLLAGLVLETFFVLSLLVPPLLLDKILGFVQDDHYLWRSGFYCGTLFIVLFIGKVIQSNYLMYLLMTTSQVKSALIAAIFRKNLLVASSSRKDFSSGSITNLISVDVPRISNFALYATMLITSPFRVILTLIYLWHYLGVASIAGVVLMLLLIPVSFYMARISEKYTEKQMSVKDVRLKYINEILNGIKILKFYAWEVPFSLKVSKTRKEEIKWIRLSQLCYICTSFIFESAPILVSISTFATYLLISSRNILDPQTAFVSLNLLQQLRFALFGIPDAISELIQTMTAIERIRNFLVAEETDLSIVGCSPNEGDAVSFKNASFIWSDDGNFVLGNLSLRIPLGKLVAVIGPVGSGKSSLLSAVLGDMRKSAGSIDVKGNLAYVPQEAWILNRTLKNNILLEKTMQEDKYNHILDCCCLRPDLDILPGKDETEIGEKGINLSGGQKQRVSLARALFQNRDIYLLDDPLSAVDAHVRKSLFEDVIGNNGLLKNKTRILVTHDISVLPHVDLIIRLEEGKIIETGSYKDLLDGSATFLNFVKTHSGKDNENSEKNSETNSVGEAKKLSYGRTISQDWAKAIECKQKANVEGDVLIEEEKMEEGGVKRGIYFNYVNHIGWLLFTCAVLGYTAFVVAETGSNIWIAKWSADPVVNGTSDHSQTVYRLLVYGGLGLAQAVAIVFGVACLVYGSTKASELYHSQMLDSVLKSPMSFYDVTPMGRIVNRFSTDMDTLDMQIIYNIESWIFCVLTTIAITIVIGMNTPIFLACLLPLVLIYYMFLRFHLNASRQIRRLGSTTRSPIYSHLLESIYGASSIKAFNVGSKFVEKLEENVDNHIACSFSTAVCNRWLSFWLDLISCIIISIATWLALYNRHELGASVVGLLVSYAFWVTDNMMWLVRSNNELENKSVAIERVDEYCHLTSEAVAHKLDYDPVGSWPEKGEIVFDNYSTRYRESLDLVLKDVNLNVLPHEKVGIVGRTGAGKSSVTLALFRIIEPAHGTILIDNVDISNIGLYALRSKLTIIPQDPVLFTGSLRFNLDPNDEYEDTDVWSSLANAHLKEFVSNLPDGLLYKVEEGGTNLSAGQKQLLCLSRALLKRSKILILDEATAAVDMDTDRLVQDTIKTAFADHTVITIAHRLNTVMDYNKIVVMDSGKVAEVGNPVHLLQNKDSLFYKLSQEAGLA